MRFSVETWAPDYGGGMETADLEATSDVVDVDVELPADQWRPVVPTGPPLESVAFVDGVRRIDARVWVHEGDVARPGVCASVAAGVVGSVGGRARVVDARVARGLFTTAADAGPIATRWGTYELHPVADDTVDALYLRVHEAMIALESEVAAALEGMQLLVVDGPLRGRSDLTAAVGYVKTHHVAYLPDPLMAVVGRLAPGERSPVFLVGGRFTRWSWYARLPGPIAHPLSGIVRCELPAVGTIDAAADRADTVTATIGRFASEAHKDPRAPQNLYPIAGLESELRRRLGDPLLLERSLRRAATPTSHA